MTEDTDDLELFKKYVYWTEDEVACYNAAIDKAIGVVDQYWYGAVINGMPPDLQLTSKQRTKLISKLKALKR